MPHPESIWYSPAYLLTTLRTVKANCARDEFEHSSKFQRHREVRTALVAAASLHIQTGDIVFIQSAQRSDDPPDIRMLRIPQSVIRRLPCVVHNETIQIENVEVTTYRITAENETLHEQLARTKWREGYDYNGVILVETDKESLPDEYLDFPDITQTLWLVVNNSRRSSSGAFFISIFPERRKVQINVGHTAAIMRQLNSPDVIVVANRGVRHRHLYAPAIP